VPLALTNELDSVFAPPGGGWVEVRGPFHEAQRMLPIRFTDASGKIVEAYIQQSG